MLRGSLVSPFLLLGGSMSERVVISEVHVMKGDYPDVPVYQHVDVALLTQNDPDPFYITLPIAEVGRRSKNRVNYDEELVTTIAEQVASVGGFRGHLRDDQLDTAYPVDDVYWVGHLRKGNTLWAKGYIPPGDTREDTRRKKATNRGVATSIHGDAVKEMTGDKNAVRLRNFVMDSLDLAPEKRASLPNRRGFAITREISEGKNKMDPITSVSDVPETIREQIIRDAKVRADASRVSELETQNQELTTQVAEMRQYATVVGEIRGVLGPDADVSKVVAEYHKQMTKLSETLGVSYTNVGVRVEEMHEQVKEMQQEKFSRTVGDKVAEFTKWNVTKPEDVKVVEQFRTNFAKRIDAETNKDATKVAETAQRIWGDEFQLIAEQMVKTFGGPPAIVGGKPTSNSPVDTLRSEAGTNAVLEKFGRK